jgi:hypothetical protein
MQLANVGHGGIIIVAVSGNPLKESGSLFSSISLDAEGPPNMMLYDVVSVAILLSYLGDVSWKKGKL